MQNFNLIAQSVLKLSHRDIDHNNNDDDNNDTRQAWIIVSVADKNTMLCSGSIIFSMSHSYALNPTAIKNIQADQVADEAADEPEADKSMYIQLTCGKLHNSYTYTP